MGGASSINMVNGQTSVSQPKIFNASTTSKMDKKTVNQRGKCPFEDPDNENPFIPEICPFHQVEHNEVIEETNSINSHPKIILRMYFSNQESADVLHSLGGGDHLLAMTTRFYAHVFRDSILKKFIFEEDGAAAHGLRLGNWIIEKMGGEGEPWSDSGRSGMRQVSHAKAWHSRKRPENERGRRFKLLDCRIWMRLMFLSARETGLDKNQRFWHWYVEFIGHFIKIYEASAGKYAWEDARWSAKEDNVISYKEKDFIMSDI